MYTADKLGNIWEGRKQHWWSCFSIPFNAVKTSGVNASSEVLEDVVIAAIKADTPVYFTCDARREYNPQTGVWDCKQFDIKAAYGLELELSKAQRITSRDIEVSYVMQSGISS